MGQALQIGPGTILQKTGPLRSRQDGFDYLIERHGSETWYQVSDGQNQIRSSVAFSFGLGEAGQTYLLEHDGTWYESRVSYYRELHGLDLTTGAKNQKPHDLIEAFGRQLSKEAAVECFRCHATGAVVKGSLETAQLTPGVKCARCHEQTARHAESLSKSDSPKIIPPKMSRMTTEETSDFCGQCHRTWAQIAAQGPHNIANVRFQPYRLANSKCYDATDNRIRCTSCHDPHVEVARETSYYDGRCQSCHAPKGKTGAKLCAAGKKQDCASCHMPRVEIAETHNRFTDHWIRVVRSGDPYPD